MSKKVVVKPQIRSNVFLTAHPIGLKYFVGNQINEAKKLSKINKGKINNVLIIGGSSGYGLSSRIVSAYNMGANTINVSFEGEPTERRVGTAGYWNNLYFRHFAKQDLRTKHFDLNKDAFSDETKQEVIQLLKDNNIKVDLVIYSLASGVRPNEAGDLVRSAIKPIGKVVVGKTFDIAKGVVQEITVNPATEEEIDNTVFVMGGGDWQNWITKLMANDLLNEGCKTISYTYVGGDSTKDIYRSGTIGRAKEDLERSQNVLNQLISSKCRGEALISSSKAVVTKASVFIPQMPAYVACLYDVMMADKTHESILKHKHRLFKDMVYGNKRIVDNDNRIRIDHLEIDEKTQNKTIKLMNEVSDDELLNLGGTAEFLQEFYQMNGFNFDEVDYEQEIDVDELLKELNS